MNRNYSKTLSKTLPALVLLGAMSVAPVVTYAAEANTEAACAKQSGADDLWTDTRLETAYLLNPNLSAFTIHSSVEDGKVTLTGTVRSDVDRDLAEEIAKSLKGVKSVDNELEVDQQLQPAPHSAADRDFLQKVSDATTTAQVKIKLMANKNISASDINVDTRNHIVQLRGKVGSTAQRELAEYIARNTHGVHKVQNDLDIAARG